MPMFEKTAMKAIFSFATIALSISATSATAEETPIIGDKKPVIAKLLILPGNNIPTGLSDVDSLARDVNLSGAFEGSSSHNADINQVDIIDDAILGKTAFGGSKPRKQSIAKRKSTKIKKQRVKVARTSITQRTIKRRASLIMGVYR